MSSVTLLRRKVGDLIKEICRGDYVLPHFQRKYVWGEEEICELLDSIREDLYIGAPVVVPYSSGLSLSHRCLPGVSCVEKVGSFLCNPCLEPMDDETFEAEESHDEHEHDDVASPKTETQISGETSHNPPQRDERDNSSLQDESASQGVKSPAPPTPKYFVLDGQQRLSTIFYLLNCDTIAKCPHTHRPDKMNYVIFVNINKVDRKNSIYEYTHIVRYSTSPRSNYANLVGSKDYITLEDAYKEYLLSGGSSGTFCSNLSKKRSKDSKYLLNLYDFLSAIHNYELDIVEVTHLSDIRKMSLLFDRINRTGVELSLSDLAVAYFYSGFGLDLKRLWKDSVKTHTTELRRLPTSLQMSEFEKEFDPVLLVLRIMSHMQGKSIKKGDLLSNFDPKTLSRDRLEKLWKEAVKYLVEAIKRLHNSYGVYSYKALPNKVTLRLLAAFLYIVDTQLPGKGGTIIPTCGITLDEFIDCWYWTSVFTGRYSGESSPTSEDDTRDFLAFIKSLSSGSTRLPGFCDHSTIVDLKLAEVTKDNYISRAILNLVYLRYLNRPSGLPTIDWFLNVLEELNEVDHIFPVSSGRGPKGGRESILNKTLVTATTNKSKSGKSPSQLITDMHSRVTPSSDIPRILDCHFINSSAEKAMKSDNYDDFIRERNEEIIKHINTNIFGKCPCCKIAVR